MYARHFQFNAFRNAFAPRKPRHPLLRQRGKPVARDHAMEGEYRVVRKQALPLPR